MTDERFTRRRMLALTGGIATVGLGGIVSGATGQGESGDDAHDHDHDHELGRPESHVEVAMRTDEDGHHFVPHVVHVEEGGTVEWVLESGVHDVVAYHPANADLLPSSSARRIPENAEPWASDVYATEGATFERTFEREGIYDYTCTIGGHGRGRGHGPGGHHGSDGWNDPGGHHGPGGRYEPDDSRPGDRPGRDDRRGIDGRRERENRREPNTGEYDDRRGTDGWHGSADGHCPGHGSGSVDGSSYHHRTHEASGMVGRVVVGWPDVDPDREPALRTPSADLPEAARREFASFDERTRAALDDDGSR